MASLKRAGCGPPLPISTSPEMPLPDLETELRRRFAVRTERFAHGAFEAEVILPEAADELIDEAAFDADERLPYWADLWPSARALARWLLDGPAPRGAVLELGCGVALPSLALLARAAEVLATDWYADALAFARANAERNGLPPLRTALLDWRAVPAELGRFGTVVAADVLYEARNAEDLALALPGLVAPGGTAVVADPGPVYRADFVERMAGRGWSVGEERLREPSEHARAGNVEIHVLTLRPPG
ncbi:MAG TPA: methyltransferase domain-containing protein [Longimicrobiaceae bacterium]|nr:methyltransferase domain-containing protein [Longimicrobiaceae bacterium]